MLRQESGFPNWRADGIATRWRIRRANLCRRRRKFSFNSPGEGWLRLYSDFFIFRDFAAFHGDATERAIALFAWVDAECAKLKTVLALPD
jgi:hypothetical protein